MKPIKIKGKYLLFAIVGYISLFFLLTSCPKNSQDSYHYSYIDDNDTENLYHSSNDDTPPTKNYDYNYAYSTNVNGRGESDIGREEPKYVGLTGYVSVHKSYDIDTDDDASLKSPWNVPIYEKDKQFYNEIGTVEHKTQIKVLRQELEHQGWGSYSGYLLVEDVLSSSQFYINVKNFITTPYWDNKYLPAAAKEGLLIANYIQTSDFYPVDKDGDKVTLTNDTLVLVTDYVTARQPSTPIEARVFKNWTYGYGGVYVYFNSSDLEIIY